MSELLIVKQIEETLLKIVTHEDNPAIIFVCIDTSVENGEVVPFLNIYGSLVFDGYNLDNALKDAVDNCDSGFIVDVLEEIDSSSYEINLSVFYPNWPDELETGDQKVINIINSVINKNKEKFNLVEKLYFHYLDNLDFVKIIDKPILKNSDSEMETEVESTQSIENNLPDIDEVQQKLSLENEAWNLVHSKQYDLAQEKCNAIITIDPEYSSAFFLEARILWYKEGFEACLAKKDYFIAKTQHEPTALARIYNNYGCLYDLQLLYEEALPYFEKAILSDPKNGMYACNLAELYCKLNNPKKAIENAGKAKKLGHESSALNTILESKGMRYI